MKWARVEPAVPGDSQSEMQFAIAEYYKNNPDPKIKIIEKPQEGN